MPPTNPSLSQATALSTLKHSVDTEQPPDIDLIKMDLNGLIEFWKRFDDIQSELEALDENQEPRRYEIQNEYYAIVVRANKIIEKAQPTLPQRRGTVESLATSVTAPMAIKLPEMRLPSFDGNIEDWVSYFDTFKSTIDSNENLTPLQKLQYLRSTLHGKALKCISALNTTDANYYDAIELLKRKYDCPRRIILKHCDAIRDYPRLVKDTPEALDDLVNSVNQHLRALKNLGEDFTRCNGFLISMILSKVSSDTAWLWELTIKGKNMPSYTDLLDFLEKRASCAQTGPSSASAVPLRPRPNFTSYPQSTRPSANFTSHPQSTRPPARSHAFVTNQEIDRGTIKIPPNLHLADPEFHRPAPIDLLLGSGTALSILCVGQIVLSRPDESDLYLQKSQLGWVIGGSAPVTSPAHGTLCHATTALQFDLTRFWEVEEGPQRQHLSESDIICESHFQEHTVRNRDGRYVVALPFNEKLSRLGDSKVQAKKRLHSLERKLQREPALKQEYHAVIQEYLDLGHMSELPQEQQSPEGYYLPHHGVVKVTSDTTKLRVVFDGSATTNSGIALNDALHTGPKIQDDLLHILLRFRIHRYVLTGDIEKMYRQFLLSRDEGHRFPQAGKILLRDFYVDDVLTGTSTIEEALSLREDLTQILKTARLTIRQWASNDLTLLTGLPEQAINKKLYLGESSTLKTLGIVWNSSNDSITYAVETCSPPSRSTKRSITSEIAKIYDPLGLLGPVIITAKMLLQRIWTIKVDWDESLPMDIHTEWIRFYNKLPALNNITFPRRTIIESPRKVELHGFSDASEKAYGACLYLRTTDSRGHSETTLLFAKSKVAPLKTISIPRLELCGALLLTSLVETAKQALPVEIHKTIYWTDSTIVLHWVKTSPHTLKTFVANRVSEIQRRTANADWRHVPTADNPADLISRGQSPEDFLQPSIWQHGPTWLNEEESFWPTTELPQPETIPEQRVAICLKALICDTTILDNCSSWGKLQRIIARCLRWKGSNTTKGSLTSSELRYAHDVIIKLIQRQHFAEELRCLSRSEIGVKGKLQQLNPFIDKDGILRVGGRLKNSRIPFAQKHPIVLPKARITALIIEHEHRIQLHAGTQATLYAIRRRYWPIDGRSQVGKTIRNCVRCYRVQPPPTQYVMGDLPEARVTDSRPFANVGVDYCGPFFIKERRYRSRTHIKVYVAVFVCLSVKAIHLELVSDLTSEAFIAALRRFIARRGHCINIYSDNGTNFVGANNELRDLRELLQSDDHNEKVKTFLADRSITWNFIPPLTPHFGGIWEAAVKSFKRHFWRIAGAERFTFEVFNTLIIEIEAVLNSRPLTPISSDPNDTLVLTPGHFLIGDSLTSLRERDFRDVPSNRLSTWQHIQKLKQHFWNRWYKEYLNEMTSRSRWSSGTHPIKEGTIVLLREDNVPPMQWPLGRVIKVYPGSDGIVRAATVRTATTTLDRGVKRLVPLPNQPEEEPRDPTSTSRTRDPSTDNN
ncbi:uncharacterized protein LOC143363945 [Halictus rubicundus]|uniref:uncharacterized protein LOC143363945 n=1 Tax=Halictus rubicundus TaxID=77578 RepID=UPI004035B7B8